MGGRDQSVCRFMIGTVHIRAFERIQERTTTRLAVSFGFAQSRIWNSHYMLVSLYVTCHNYATSGPNFNFSPHHSLLFLHF